MLFCHLTLSLNRFREKKSPVVSAQGSNPVSRWPINARLFDVQSAKWIWGRKRATRMPIPTHRKQFITEHLNAIEFLIQANYLPIIWQRSSQLAIRLSETPCSSVPFPLSQSLPFVLSPFVARLNASFASLLSASLTKTTSSPFDGFICVSFPMHALHRETVNYSIDG